MDFKRSVFSAWYQYAEQSLRQVEIQVGSFIPRVIESNRNDHPPIVVGVVTLPIRVWPQYHKKTFLLCAMHLKSTLFALY